METGVSVFLAGLCELGYQPSTLPGQPNHVVIDYEVQSGKFTGKSLKLGAPPEFKTRYEGLIGLKQQYGVNPTFVPLAIGLQYKALDDGKIQAADVFTTDGALQGGKYKILKDPKFIFGFQNVSPIVSQKVLNAQGPDFADTLNA